MLTYPAIQCWRVERWKFMQQSLAASTKAEHRLRALCSWLGFVLNRWWDLATRFDEDVVHSIAPTSIPECSHSARMRRARHGTHSPVWLMSRTRSTPARVVESIARAPVQTTSEFDDRSKVRSYSCSTINQLKTKARANFLNETHRYK